MKNIIIALIVLNAFMGCGGTNEVVPSENVSTRSMGINLAHLKKELQNGRSINTKDTAGSTALHYAVRFGKHNIINYLISHGANVNSRDNYGETPLFEAVRADRLDVVMLLISAGADGMIRNIQNVSAKDKAEQLGRKSLSDMMSKMSTQEYKAFRKLNDKSSLEELKNFINVYPQSLLSKRVKDRMSIIEFKAIKKPTRKAYKIFLNKYPESSKREEVEKFFTDIDAAEATKAYAKILNSTHEKDFINFLKEFPFAKEAKDVKVILSNLEEKKRYQEILNKIKKYLQRKDIEGFITFVNSSDAVQKVAFSIPKIALLFNGPEELKVIKVLSYKKQGFGDAILASKIKALKKPYKNFSLDEVVVLRKFGITETLLAAMIDATSAHTDKIERKREQEELIAKQEEIAQGMKEAQANAIQRMREEQERTVQNNQGGSGSSLGDELINKAAHKAMDSLLDRLF